MFAFDHEVLPAGSALRGKVSAIQPVSKRQRFRAMVNGDFTPLRNAQLEFDSVVLPNGTQLPLHTAAVAALNSLYIEPSKKVRKTQAPQNPNNGVLGTAKAKLKDQIDGALNAGSGGFTDIVRGPNKKEKLVDFLWAKMPYHPQYLRHLTMRGVTRSRGPREPTPMFPGARWVAGRDSACWASGCHRVRRMWGWRSDTTGLPGLCIRTSSPKGAKCSSIRTP